MASSSSSSRAFTYDVFPSFRGKDVRKKFLSHFLENLNRKSIDTFIDNGIDKSRPIGPEILSAIRGSKISVVVFSVNYASSTWCLNELLEIHKCYQEFHQIVIPIFYQVDTSHVKKQTGKFGKIFRKTCNGKSEHVKQEWIQALVHVASLAGHDSQKWSSEAKMIKDISKDILDRLIITPSDDCFGDFVGIKAHIDAMSPILCMKSEEVRMVGILGPSGIGKTTIARALYNKLSSQFPFHAFMAFERNNRDTNYGMKLSWEEQLLSRILDQEDIKIRELGVVKQRLESKKVLMVLDDVDDIELLRTLAGRPEWFGPGSRVIVTTKDRKLLMRHKIDNVYEVKFPSREVALQMLCRSAFGLDSPPEGFAELAAEVVELAGNLPLGLDIIGSSLGGMMEKEEWVEMMPRLRDSLDGKIEKTLRVSYDALDVKDQELFLYIACLLNGRDVNYIRDVIGDSVNSRLKMLANKSLIRISSSSVCEIVEMHSLLQNLGRTISRRESSLKPGKRRFLVDSEDICDVLTDNTGTESVRGICLNASEMKVPLVIDEESFKGMPNLRFLEVYDSSWWSVYIPYGLAHLSRKLRILYWHKCPLRCLPSNFKAEYLVELTMRYSKLERLWEGTQRLQSLKKLNLLCSESLEEIPDLSYAINLEEMDLFSCKSLVTLPSSIRNLGKLRALDLGSCSSLKILPTDVNLESLEQLNLQGCFWLRSFPQISRNISKLYLGRVTIEEESSLWIENMSRLTDLVWDSCPQRCLPSYFRPEYLVYLSMRNSELEKLWEGAQSLGNLKELSLSGSENLSEFPNLSKVTNLEKLYLDDCISLVTVPSSIQSLDKLCELSMEKCRKLEALPTDVNLKSLKFLSLGGCSRLRCFPRISTSVESLYLDHTAIEDVPSWIEDLSELTTLMMRGCRSLTNVSPNIFRLKCLKVVNLSGTSVTEFCDASVLTRLSRTIVNLKLRSANDSLFRWIFKKSRGTSDFFSNPEARLNFDHCLSLYGSARAVILESDYEYAVLPGGEVPRFLMHRARGSSIHFPESSLSEESVGFKACVVLEPPNDSGFRLSCVGVYCYFRGSRYAVHCLHFDKERRVMEHLLMFHFRFPTQELINCPSELDRDGMAFEFYYHTYDSLNEYNSGIYSRERIKGCGVEFCSKSRRCYCTVAI